jgi:hypothetical protein
MLAFDREFTLAEPVEVTPEKIKQTFKTPQEHQKALEAKFNSIFNREINFAQAVLFEAE